MKRTTTSILISIVLAGCTGEPTGRVRPENLPNTGDPALHAVHDTHLRELMAEMNILVFDRMRTELELDRERRKQALKIAEVAAQMQKTVGYIIATLPGLALSRNEQTTFLTLADKLRSRVKTLETQAQRNYLDAIPGTLDQIETTCTACHQLFRKMEPAQRKDS